MSLKGFHVFFIMVAALFSAAMAAWAFLGASSEVLGEAARGFGVGAIVSAIGLFAYGIWFALKKGKTIIV
jgi:hypothetical protein